MTTGAPILAVYDGEGQFTAVPNLRAECDRRFCIGERYLLNQQEERSAKSHRHYFATINDAWASLPEGQETWATPEHLRKHALIRTGYHDRQSFVASSRAQARYLRAFVLGMTHPDDYAIVIVDGATVTRYTAKSQGLKAMGKEEFQASKDAVLAWIADHLQATVEEMQRVNAA